MISSHIFIDSKKNLNHLILAIEVSDINDRISFDCIFGLPITEGIVALSSLWNTCPKVKRRTQLNLRPCRRWRDLSDRIYTGVWSLRSVCAELTRGRA